MDWIEIGGFGILTLLFIYMAIRIGAVAWFRSKSEYSRGQYEDKHKVQ